MSGFVGKSPIAKGVVVRVDTPQVKNVKAQLRINKGRIYDGQYLVVGKSNGTIKRVASIYKSNNLVSVELEGNFEELRPNDTFRIFSNIRIVNISLLVELILIFCIFFLIFRNLNPWNKVAISVLLATILLWLYRNLVLGNIHTHGAYFNGGTTLLIILFALLFFYYQLANTDNLFIYLSAEFWIVTGILLYKAGTFFLFLYANTLDQNEKANFYLINSGFYIIQNLLFSVSFLMNQNKVLQNNAKNPNRYS